MDARAGLRCQSAQRLAQGSDEINGRLGHYGMAWRSEEECQFYHLVPSEPRFPLPFSRTYNISTELWESNKIVHFLTYSVREEQCSYWNCCFHHSPIWLAGLPRRSPSGDYTKWQVTKPYHLVIKPSL